MIDSDIPRYCGDLDTVIYPHFLLFQCRENASPEDGVFEPLPAGMHIPDSVNVAHTHPTLVLFASDAM